MAMKIIILEDNAERQAAMRACLRDRFHQYEIQFFDRAEAMTAYLEAHLAETLAIALDHDLELLPNPDGTGTDPGTGRDVVEYLARQAPACPVVIHSSNAGAATGMELALREAHWVTYRVFPLDDPSWIPTAWFRTMRRAVVDAVPSNRIPVEVELVEGCQAGARGKKIRRES